MTDIEHGGTEQTADDDEKVGLTITFTKRQLKEMRLFNRPNLRAEFDAAVLPSSPRLVISYDPVWGGTADIERANSHHDLGDVELVWSA